MKKNILIGILESKNKHPLRNWIGNYYVEANSYAEPGNPYWDTTWNVKTRKVQGEDNKISITGIEGSNVPVIATLDIEEMTIEIDSSSNIGIVDVDGDAFVSLFYGTDALIANADSYDISYAMLNEASNYKIIGSIENNGTIRIDKFCLILVNELYMWDCYNTIWTKS